VLGSGVGVLECTLVPGARLPSVGRPRPERKPPAGAFLVDRVRRWESGIIGVVDAIPEGRWSGIGIGSGGATSRSSAWA